MGGVAQHLADHLGVDTAGQQDRRDRVPEVMESDRRQPSSLGLADEQARKRLRVKWPAVLGGDHQARVGVVGAPGQPLGHLTSAVSTQRIRHLRSQGEGRRPLQLLGSAMAGPAIHHDQGLADCNATGGQVHVDPTWTRQFASTHSQRGQQEPQRSTAGLHGLTRRKRFRPARPPRYASRPGGRGAAWPGRPTLATGGHQLAVEGADTSRGEPLKRDVPEPRHEVSADVVTVAAERRGPNLTDHGEHHRASHVLLAAGRGPRNAEPGTAARMPRWGRLTTRARPGPG